MEESNLSTGGHALFCHYQQGLTEYLAIALVQETEAVTMTEALNLMTVKRLDLDHIRLAARINISEWQTNRQSKQYISYLKGKQGRKLNDYFRDFIGCQEGIDGRAKPALCSRRSATLSKVRICQKSQRARKRRRWSTTPCHRPSWASLSL